MLQYLTTVFMTPEVVP